MAWVRLDDGFFRHPKVIAAGRDARDLYLAALCYCGSGLTDGMVPRQAIRLLGAEADIDDAMAAAGQLVRVGLWRPVDGGWQVHDYLDYQASKARVAEERAKTARRQDEWRERNRGGPAPNPHSNSNGVRNAVTDGVSNAVTDAVTDGVSNAVTDAVTDPVRNGPCNGPVTAYTYTYTSTSDSTSDEEHGSLRSLPAASRGKAADPPGFAAFWAAYPRNQDRKAAVEEWRRIKPDDDAQAAILAGLERAKRDEGFAGGEYAPYAVRWLKHRRWEDGDPPARGGTERLSPNSARRNRVVV